MFQLNKTQHLIIYLNANVVEIRKEEEFCV